MKADEAGNYKYLVPLRGENEFANFDVQRHRPFGQCYSTHPKNDLKKRRNGQHQLFVNVRLENIRKKSGGQLLSTI